MHYRRLGKTDIEVSAICLGTMTFGEQNTEAEAHQQLDLALDRGVNFIDCAEMYPVPPSAETQGRTETYVGSWLAARGNRASVVLATKVVGRSDALWYRGAETRLDRKNIVAALDTSLQRLQTDYIDLYQLHWPDRRTQPFHTVAVGYEPDDDAIPIADTLGVLGDLVAAGKIRQIGVSNETAWGMCQYTHAAATGGRPHIVSIQNVYSLLNRTFEIDLAEVSLRESAGLLAFSPLAMGVLAGKYLDGAKPVGSRLTLFGDRYGRYSGPLSDQVVPRYVETARRHGTDPAQLAIAFVLSRSFVTAAIIGATNFEQLATDIASIDVALSDEVLADIEAIHTSQPNPCP